MNMMTTTRSAKPRPDQPTISVTSARHLAQGLAWFSIGLGVLGLLVPRKMSRLAGMRPAPATVRLYAVRELATSAGILASDDPTPWMWARVGGDVLDFAAVASGLHPYNRRINRTVFSLAAIGAIGLLDHLAADTLRYSPKHTSRQPARLG